MVKEDIVARLRKLDLEASHLFHDAPRLQCVLVGGSALVLKEYIQRSTQDIDMLRASRELLGLLEKYDMNTNVTAHLDSFPESYPGRLQPFREVETEKIDYFIPSLEDLVISKLAARRERDIVDITHPDVLSKIDWTLLGELAAEVSQSMLSDRQKSEFLHSYNDFKEAQFPCGPFLSMDI